MFFGGPATHNEELSVVCSWVTAHIPEIFQRHSLYLLLSSLACLLAVCLSRERVWIPNNAIQEEKCPILFPFRRHSRNKEVAWPSWRRLLQTKLPDQLSFMPINIRTEKFFVWFSLLSQLRILHSTKNCQNKSRSSLVPSKGLIKPSIFIDANVPTLLINPIPLPNIRDYLRNGLEHWHTFQDFCF